MQECLESVGAKTWYVGGFLKSHATCLLHHGTLTVLLLGVRQVHHLSGRRHESLHGNMLRNSLLHITTVYTL